jgi:hypothetical protein
MDRKLLQNLENLAGDDSTLEEPEKVQERVLFEILRKNQNTLFARTHGFEEIDSVDTYVKKIPIAKYEDFKPYIQEMKSGTPRILLAEDFPRWAQTSGTTSSPKLYPFPAEMAEAFGQTLAKIMLSCIEEEPERRKILHGKMLMVVADVATHCVAGKPVGYISGMVSHDVQKMGGMDDLFTPPCEVLAMENWETRWLEMARSASQENVTMTCSTPPILLSYFKRISHEYSSVLDLPEDIAEIWPDLTLITGAGVKMSLYEKQYQHILGDQACCREFYCATEGFFAYQKDKKEGLTPILDRIFYEFIPLEEWNCCEKGGEDYRTYEFTRLTYAQTNCHEDYVLVLTTPTGLYSYVIGDIIRFVRPDKITWAGRIGRESNVAGEKFNELHMSMLRQSVEATLGIEITNQMAAVKEDPLRYVFAFEFDGTMDTDEAIDAVDRSLREANAIYDRLRKMNILKRPDIVTLQRGTFDRYFQWHQKKTGSMGQVKPPVFASSELVEELAKPRE